MAKGNKLTDLPLFAISHAKPTRRMGIVCYFTCNPNKRHAHSLLLTCKANKACRQFAVSHAKLLMRGQGKQTYWFAIVCYFTCKADNTNGYCYFTCKPNKRHGHSLGMTIWRISVWENILHFVLHAQNVHWGGPTMDHKTLPPPGKVSHSQSQTQM